MSWISHSYVAVLLALLCFIQTAFAVDEQAWNLTPEKFRNSYQCMVSDSKGEQTFRYILVEYSSGDSLPCKVVYKKPSEGQESKLLWQSNNTSGYCEQKARSLADKLRGFGWSCALPKGQEPYAPKTGDTSGASTASLSATDVDIDFNLPEISLEQSSHEPVAGETFELVVKVTDNTGIKGVAFYHKSESQGFLPMAMSRMDDSDLYSVTLQNDLTSQERLQYYVLAEDISENSALFGNSISPKSIQFKQAQNKQEAIPEQKVVETMAINQETTSNSATEITSENIESITQNATLKSRTKNEQSLWDRATNENNVEGYESYIKMYPYGSYTSLARLRLANLKKINVGDIPEATKGVTRSQPLKSEPSPYLW